MITTLIIAFFGLSCFASVVVFAACVASARADEVQRHAFSNFYEETEQYAVERRPKLVTAGKLALNP